MRIICHVSNLYRSKMLINNVVEVLVQLLPVLFTTVISVKGKSIIADISCPTQRARSTEFTRSLKAVDSVSSSYRKKPAYKNLNFKNPACVRLKF